MKLDAKTYIEGHLRKVKDDSIIPDDEWVVFYARDDCLPSLLALYEQMLRDRKADDRQIEAVRRLRGRVITWRQIHPEKCKVPDIDVGEKLWETQC